MPGVTITKNRLGAIAAGLRPQLSQVVDKTGFDLEAREKELAAVDTGFMRNSIQYEKTGDLSGVVAVGAEYAPYVNYGTSRSPAQPFVEPAVDAVRPGFEAAVKQVIERG